MPLKFNSYIKLSSLFNIAFAIYYAGLIVSVTAIPYSDLIKKGSMIISFCLLLLICLYYYAHAKGIKRSLLLKLLLVFLLLVISVFSSDYHLLMILSFSIAMSCISEIDIMRLLKISIVISIIISLFAVAGCILGLIPNINSPRGWDTGYRLAWGFAHSQVLTLIVFYSVLYYFCIKRKARIIEIIVFSILIILLARFFDARNAMYSSVLFFIMLILYMFLKKLIKRDIKVFLLSSIIPLIMTAFTFVTVYFYNKGVSAYILLDNKLSSRIRLSSMNLQVLPIKILNFVSYSEYESKLANTVDNGYLYIVLRYGIVFVFVVLVLFINASKCFKEKRSEYGSLALVAAGISAFVGNPFTGCYFFPFIVIALSNLFSQRRCNCLSSISYAGGLCDE